MKSLNNFTASLCTVLFSIVLVFQWMSLAHAQENNGQAELNGDEITYSADGNVVMASGNVIIIYKDLSLYCDKVEYFQVEKTAHAKGNVRLVTNQGEISGSEMTFNLETRTGDFHGARIVADPYYGAADKIEMVSENKIELTDGFITTSDFDKPEYRIQSRKIEIYPQDKVVARKSRLMLGNIPTAYIPKYTQRLDDRQPRFHFTPGYDSDWGAFLLSEYRYYLNDYIKGTIHADYRERLDFASGFTVDYNTPSYGDGLVKTYYTHERNIGEQHLWDDPRTEPTVESERYRVEWRHKWKVDEKTNFIGQYYLLSDRTFLKDYFENEFDHDQVPDTFFLLTRNMPQGVLSLRSDIRINRFVSDIERLPEIKYDLSNFELGDTNVYWKNTSSYTKFTRKDASPTEFNTDTQRFHTDNELSYPTKLGFLEFKPFVGGMNTYYTDTKDEEANASIRGIFRTGATLSTKFYRQFDVVTDKFGLDINRLRHVVTPSISYIYRHEPTIASSQLERFDSIDSQTRAHNVGFSLENKLQTKRNGETVELLRAVIGTDYRLKEDPRDSGFDKVSTDIDFRPTDWLTLYADSSYDLRNDHLDTANFDFYINGADEKWRLGVGKRYNRAVGDQVTAYLNYDINPKWDFRLLQRIDVNNGKITEQEYVLTRDLHTWEVDFHVNDTRAVGTEYVVVFRLKAFPEIGVDFGTTYDKRDNDDDL